jgi:hypothetical protein
MAAQVSTNSTHTPLAVNTPPEEEPTGNANKRRRSATKDQISELAAPKQKQQKAEKSKPQTPERILPEPQKLQVFVEKMRSNSRLSKVHMSFCCYSLLTGVL